MGITKHGALAEPQFSPLVKLPANRLISIYPGETAVFDFEKIRHDQEADNVGTRLPLTASLGQFKWAIHGVTNGKLLLIGRAEMVSRSKHISTSYSCNDPCPPYLVGWLDGLDTPIIVNATSNTSAWQTAYYDSGYNMGPYSVPADWSVDSSAISIDPYSAHATIVTGEDPGDGCVTADMGWQERYSWDGQNCYDNNFADPIGDSGCTEVRCPPTSETTTFGGWADSDGYPTVAKWNQTLLPTSASFVGRSVTETDPGGTVDDCYFTNSEIDEVPGVDGSTWEVTSGNHWGPDANGLDGYSVTYYRNHGRAPCTITVPQRMVIDCPSGNTAYVTHTLTYTIGTQTIRSEHNGAIALRAWP